MLPQKNYSDLYTRKQEKQVRNDCYKMLVNKKKQYIKYYWEMLVNRKEPARKNSLEIRK